jgi:hypothetical protein
MAITKEAALKEITARYNSGALSVQQIKAYDELVTRGALPPISKASTSPINIGKREVVIYGGSPTRPERIVIPEAEIAARVKDGRDTKTGFSVYEEGPSEYESGRAQMGVDTSTGGPANIRGKASLVPRDQKNSIVSQMLKQQLGPETQTRQAPDGGLEYTVKDKSGILRWTQFDETRFTGKDVLDIAEDIAPAITEAVAMWKSGPALTKIKDTPVAIGAEALISGTATGLTEAARLSAGRLAGLHDAPVIAPALEEGGKAAAFAAGAGAAFEGGRRLYRGAQSFSKGEAEMLLSQSKANQENIDLINKRLLGEGAAVPQPFTTQAPEQPFDTGEDVPFMLRQQSDEGLVKDNQKFVSENKFKPSIGATADSPIVQDMEATSRRGNIKVEMLARERDRGNDAALDDLFDIVSGPQSTNYQKGGKDIQDVMRAETDRKIANIRTRVKEYTKGVTDKIEELPTLDVSKVIQDARLDLNAKHQIVKDAEKAKWNAIDAEIGFDPKTATSKISIPVSGKVQETIDTLDAEALTALTKEESTSKLSLISGKLRKSVKPEYSVSGALTGESVKPAELDISAMNRSISYFKKLERNASNGISPDAVKIRDIVRIRTAMEQTRNEVLKKNNPELLTKIEDAEAATRLRYEQFKKGPVGKVLRKEGDFYYLDDNAALTTLIAAKNSDAAARYASALKGDPRSIQGARNMILGLYNETVVKNGIADRNLHKKFMKEYEGTMKPFFSKEDYFKLNQIGGMSKVVESGRKRLDQLEKQFKNTFRGRVLDMNPESIVSSFFSKAKTEGGNGFSIDDVRKLKVYSGLHGDGMIQSYQEAVKNELRQRISIGEAKSSEKLRKMMVELGDFEKGQTGKLTNLFGHQYTQDLRLLYNGLKLAEQKGSSLAKQTEGIASRVEGVALGPLSTGVVGIARRGTTFMQYLKLSLKDEEFFKITSDPDNLRLIIKNRDVDSNSRRAFEVLSSVGLSSIYNGNFNKE